MLVSFVDADSNQSGNQNTIKLELDINPAVTRNVEFDLALDNFGPIQIGSAGNVDVTLGGNIDLDLGFNFASLKPYVFDSTSFALTADIDTDFDVSAGIGGLQAELEGMAQLKDATGMNPASITVSINQTLSPSDSNTIGAIPIEQLLTGGIANTFDFNIDGAVTATFDADLPVVTVQSPAIQVDYTIGGAAPTITSTNLANGVDAYLASLTDLSSMSLDQLIDGSRDRPDHDRIGSDV